MRTKYYFFFLIAYVLVIESSSAANASRSDSTDIRKTIIHFDMTDVSNQFISANCILSVKSKLNNISTLQFDLEGLTVDSIKVNNLSNSFSHNSPNLTIPLLTPMNTGDSAEIQIYYHGTPIVDATWGGFYFSGNYAFQMGVGFNAQPHSYGRTWHPCFDNFVERSPYEFFVKTSADKMAVCNGLLIDSALVNINQRLWHWKLNEEIPSYLASVALSNYMMVQQTLTGINGSINAEIACEIADSLKVVGSFAHLQDSYTMLENNFGAYSWPKVGYTLVPFNAGAMEHATNIHIGRGFVDGTLDNETLIAHELSHHWWGDLVTCSTAGDMWLNEGFASYCESLHQESTYGSQAYINNVRSNHFDVLSNAHIRDNGYRSLANMDSNYTYGTTVYNKGADAIHSMRSYLGDSLFFEGTKAFLNANKFKEISSADLRDFLSTWTGKNMTNYFDNWIFEPGFTNFCIDSTQVVPNGSNFDIKVFLRQRKHHSTNYYNGVPLELGFYNAQMNIEIFKLDFNGRCMEFDVTLPYNPEMIIIDPNYKISDAVTEDVKIVKNIGNSNFTQAKCRLFTQAILTSGDSAFMHISHHWVAPDRFKQAANFPGYILNDSRYWNVNGIQLSNIKGLMIFTYNATAGNSYLDSSWVKNTEDSIRMFYRKDATEDWQFANDSLVAGGLTDKVGTVYIKNIQAGEFCFGIKRSNFIDPLITDAPSGSCGIVTRTDTKNMIDQIVLFPNPTREKLILKLQPLIDEDFNYEVYNLTGQKVQVGILLRNSLSKEINLNQRKSGIYFIKLIRSNGAIINRQKIIKEE